MADQDFLIQINDAESAAEAIVAEATEQSRLNLEKARQDAKRMIEEARLETEQDMHQKVHAAELEAVSILAETRRKFELETVSVRESAKSRISDAVSAIQERIVSNSDRR